jgi:hypothetical protein
LLDAAELGPALLRLNWERSARLKDRLVDQGEPLLEHRAGRLHSRLASQFGVEHRDPHGSTYASNSAAFRPMHASSASA